VAVELEVALGVVDGVTVGEFDRVAVVD